ncbi:MAG: AAA family ATPase [Lachnospiraceae bacterium]|nr:AAA family ATPase [Lachnospiraceae bacterium]
MTEEKYFELITDSLNKSLTDMDDMIIKWQRKITKQKEFMWDNSSDMDEEELLANKEDIEQDMLLLEFYNKNRNILCKTLKNPYFGKINFIYDEDKSELPVYIGLSGYRSDDESLPWIYDWRAPISSMYYEYEKGKASYNAPDGEFTGEITEKKQFKIKDGEMLYYMDTDLKIDDDVLVKELSNNSATKMRQVAATIQKEQNAIIRNNKAKTLVINGCAGSGKTVVALHRVAWLLYNYRKHMRADNVLILSPNALFSDYISEVLPELCEDNVPEKEWDDLMVDMICIEDDYEIKNDQINYILHSKEDDDRIKRIRYKSSKEYFDELNTYIKRRDRKIKDASEVVRTYIEFLEYIGGIRPGMERYLNEDGLICYEDVLAVFYIQVYYYGCGQLGSVRYLVVDEMQDYNIFQYAIINKMFVCPKTFLGDENQVYLRPVDRLSDIISTIFDDASYISMNKSYRSTYEITQFVQGITKLDNIEPFERHGKKPEIVRYTDSCDKFTKMRQYIKEISKNDYRTIAILCDDEYYAREVYEELKKDMDISLIRENTTVLKDGIIVMSKHVSKGLEFDAVIVNCDNDTEDEISKNALYISCTRALHELYLFEPNR